MLGLFAAEAHPPRSRAALDPADEQPNADALVGGHQQCVPGQLDQGVVEAAVEADVVAMGQGCPTGERLMYLRHWSKSLAPYLCVRIPVQDAFAGHQLEREPNGP